MRDRLRRAWGQVRPRAIAAELVSLVGLAAICAGVATWSLGAALVVGGVGLLGLARGIER